MLVQFVRADELEGLCALLGSALGEFLDCEFVPLEV
jgi:DNA-binding Xre family transcriptional regulator